MNTHGTNPPKVEETKVKQGTERPRRVAVVLAVSLTLALVAAVVVYTIFI